MPVPAHPPSPERNLLFAGLGLTLGLLTREKITRAFSEWLLNKTQTLANILVEQKAITQEQKSIIESAVELQIQVDGNEAHALASLKNAGEIENSLAEIPDSDIQQPLATMQSLRSMKPTAREHFDPFSTSDSPLIIQTAPSISKDRFIRAQFLDAGNLGEIWFAQDAELNRRVVVKYIKPEHAGSAFSKALFHLEGEVTGFLEHPGIVPVYGLGKDDKERNYYAMRFIQGHKLTRAIAEYHALPVFERGKRQETLVGLLQSFQTACLAIEYAHSKGILHCDIKPDNIVTGPFGETIVIDWGMAMVKEGSQLEREIEDAMATRSASDMAPGPYSPSESARRGLHSSQGGLRKFVGGTPAYTAPEQMRATRGGDVDQVNQASDIFSLGATLYQLLTNRAPYSPTKEKKETQQEFYSRVENGIFPSPRSINASIPKPLEAIVLKAMTADAKERYGSARELAEEVKRFMADEPLRAYQEPLLERSRRWARNHRTAVAVAALLLLFVAVGGFGFAVITQGFNEKLRASEKEARKQEANAKKREKMAIDAVKRYAESVNNNPDLKSRSELEPLRKELLKEPIQLFKELSSQLREDKNTSSESLAALATGLFELAHLTEEIGNHEDAIRSYEESVAIREALVEANPSNSEYKNALASSHLNLGNLYSDTNRAKEAEASYQKAMKIREALVEANPSNSEFKDALASSHLNLGNLYSDTNRAKEAEASYQKAMKVQEALVEANPSNSEFKNDLANSHNNLGILYRQTSRAKEAEASYQKAMKVQEALVEANPSNSRFKNDLANSHLNLGNLYSDTNRAKEAEASYLKALQIREALVEANPSNSQFKNGLARSHNSLGALYVNTNRAKEAEASYQKALQIFEPLVEANPSNSEFKNALAQAHLNLGILYRQTNRAKEAEASYQKAMKIREALVEANPSNSQYQNALASSHLNLGNLYSDTNRAKEAEASYQKAMKIREALVESNPSNSEFRNDLTRTRNNLANLHNAKAWEIAVSPKRTTAEYEKAVSLAEAASQFNPEAGGILNTLGMAQYRVKDYSKALATLIKSNQINSKAAMGKEDPGDLAFLTMTCHQLGKKKEAEEYFKKLEEVMKVKTNAENKEAQGIFLEAKTLLGKGM